MKPPTIKLFPPLLKITTKAIDDITQRHLSIDKTLQPILKNKKFGSRDRRFIIEQTYDIIRNWIYFEAVLQHAECSNDIQNKILVNLTRKGIEIINPEIVESKITFSKEGWHEALFKKTFEPRILQSFPEWIWAIGKKDYRDEWEAIAASLNSTARVYLRPNTLITSKEKLVKHLEKDGIATSSRNNSDALVLTNRENIRHHKLYRKGHFEIQDYASQQLAYFADLQPNNLIIDACAGAGGKTLHLAALKRDGGRLIASDFEYDRMKQLRFRMERAKAKEIEIIKFDQLKTFENNVDRLILDAPCTATGTIRRKAEIKWNLQPKTLQKYIDIQQKILTEQSTLVKIGGLIIYATCSIFKSESEDQVKWFLENNPNFELVREQRFFPHKDDCDGFYIGVLRKNSA